MLPPNSYFFSALTLVLASLATKLGAYYASRAEGIHQADYAVELISTFVFEFAVATFVSVLVELAMCIKRSTRYQTQSQDQLLRYMAWGTSIVLAGLALAHFIPGIDCVASADWRSNDNVKMEDAEDLREILGLVFAVLAWISIVVAYPVVFLVNKSTDEPYRDVS